jgi:hypothetical protein
MLSPAADHVPEVVRDPARGPVPDLVGSPAPDEAAGDVIELRPGAGNPTPVRDARRHWAWAAGGVAAAVAATALVLAWPGGVLAPQGTPVAASPAASAPVGATAAPAVTRLELVGADPMSSCPLVTPEAIARTEVAFRARADSVTPELVRFTVTRVFHGEVAGMVEVVPPDLADADFSGIEFAEGADYLIAASAEGLPTPTPRIALCGISGPADPALVQLYEQAFPR